MDQLFYPQSVVIIGVSEKPDNLARVIYENLLEFQFQGEILLVGKKEGKLHGRKIYPSLEELRDGIDVAVILAPAPTVPGLLESCGHRKIPWVILETGGFSEYSKAGAELEQELLTVARKWGIRMVGPNGIGIIHPENGFVVPFVAMKKGPMAPGRVSIVAQSGGISFTFYSILSSVHLGVAKVVSMGNKIDLDEVDYLKYLSRDPKTEIIGLYLESIKRGRELIESARSTPKPIIVHKANVGEGSREIAGFHTAALANDDRIVDEALKQGNIVRVRDLRSFANAVKAFCLPAMKGDRLVIVSRSGGLAIVAADAAEAHGFRLHPFTKTLQEEVHGAFRAKVIQPTNPLDLGDLFDFDLYTRILDKILQIKKVHGVLFQHGAVGAEKEPSRRLIKAIRALSFSHEKPVVLCYLTDEEELAAVKKMIDFPIFAEPADALQALAISRDQALGKKRSGVKHFFYAVNRSQVREIINRAREEKRDLLLSESLEALRAYGIPVADDQVVHKKGAVRGAIEKVGTPCALKVISPEVAHKSERGGVSLNLDSISKAEAAFQRIRKAGRDRFSGVLVQKMIPNRLEVILGARRDPSFGPVVLFGPGGIYVEIFRESSLRLAPILRSDAEEMIFESRVMGILKGARGQKPLDTGALIESLLRLSQLIVEFPEIEGIDVNPVIVLEKGAVAVDARISLASQLDT